MQTDIDIHGQAPARRRRLRPAPSPRGSSGGMRCAGPSMLTSLGCEERGGAVVETALVLPMLLMVITAIFTFAVAFNHELTLTSAVGSGAQQLQLIRTTTTDPCADTLAAIEAAAPGLTGSSINLTITMNGSSFSGSSCAGDQTYLAAGNPVTVTATYPCALAIFGTTFTHACQLSAKVTEYEY